jgi:hypothetical protein
LGKALKGLEATIKGAREHKEDSQKDFQNGFAKNQATLKTIINQKHLVASIKKSKYETTKLETIFGPSNFGKNQMKIWNSTKRHLSNNAFGNFGLATNSNLESTRNNFGLEYSTKDSTQESIVVDFEFFGLESV